MSKSSTSSKLGCLLISVVLLTSVTACGTSGTDTGTSTAAVTTTAESTQATEAPKEVVTLTVAQGTGSVLPDNAVLKEIERITSVKLQGVDMQGDKVAVMYASGESLDINQAQPDQLKSVFDNKLALPLDDLLQTHAPNMLKYHGKALSLFKKFKSNDDGKLYFLPYAGGDPTQTPVTKYQASPTGLYVRWDYFKELGVPMPNTLDEMISALVAMQKAHPVTPDGKKVYAVSGWQDWGPTWNFSIQFGFPNGTMNINNTHGLTADNEISCELTEPDSSLWEATEFYYKVNKAKILDPDFFINKYADYTGKYKAGQLLTLAASWQVSDAKAAVVKDASLSTFVAFPISQDFPYSTAADVAQYTSTVYTFIGKSCKTPERALEFMDWMSTPEASRLVSSGVEGVHWDYVDGTAKAKKEIFEQRKSDTDFMAKTGIGFFYGWMLGFTGEYICPDGAPANLLDYDTSQYILKNTEGDKDFCTAMGVTYPGELYTKLTNEGKLKLATKRINDIASFLQQPPDDIKQIDASCENYLKENLPKAVLAKDDAAFKTAKESIIKGMIELGADKSDEWWKASFNKVKGEILEALK